MNSDFKQQHFHRNLEEVEERITRAAERAGRRRGDVRLMAVTKTFPREYVRLAAARGLRLFGESRVQEIVAKFREDPLPPEAELHLIGHLQRNKVKPAAELVDCIQSVDKLATARAIDQAAGALDKVLDVLVELNTTGEEAKHGIRSGEEYWVLLDQILELPHLRVTGLMTVGPFSDDPEESRRAFRVLGKLYQKTVADYHLPGFQVLSMGMSLDFETAIEEGSSLVRLGTALFGRR